MWIHTGFLQFFVDYVQANGSKPTGSIVSTSYKKHEGLGSLEGRYSIVSIVSLLRGHGRSKRVSELQAIMGFI